MNAPTTYAAPTELTREQREIILELLADLGEFEHEFERAQALRLCAEHDDRSLAGDAQRAWAVDRRIEVELSPAEFDFLLPFVDENGSRPLDLVKVDDVMRVDVRSGGGITESWRSVPVSVNEHVTLKVLSLRIGDDERAGLLHVEGAGEYHA